MLFASMAGDAPLMLSVSGARGIVGASMTPAVAAEFAAAFGSWLAERRDEPTVCLGRDGRPSHEMLAAAATAGLLSVGCRVVDIGVAATPTVGVMVSAAGTDGGMVVTASHNPIEWNGLKCLAGDGAAPPAAEAETIVERFRRRRFRYAGPIHRGEIAMDTRGAEIHVERVLGLVDVDAIRARRFHVVLDSVNGAGCVAGRALLEALGCRVTHLNGEPTGLFAHAPEPTETNLGGLCAAVKEAAQEGPHAAPACGFAQDPDADRLAIVDERGEYIGEEYTLALAALRLLERGGSGPLVANLSTSRMIDDIAARFGAGVVRSPVGEGNVVAAMKSCGAVIGGEGNGGVIVPQVCLVRDSLSAMALTLDLLAAAEKPLSSVVAGLPRYEMIKHRIELSEVGGFAAVKPALERVRNSFADQRIDSCDGVRVDFEDGWVHVRPSNTEPIVRLIGEAGTRERVWELLDVVGVAAGLV